MKNNLILPVVLLSTLLAGILYGESSDLSPLARLEAPANNLSTVNPFPRFQWERLPGTLDAKAPIAYEIEISRDKDFKDIVDRDRINLSRYIADRPFECGNYFWHIRVLTSKGSPKGWSETRSLRINAPDETINVELKGSGEALPALRAAFEKTMELNRSGRSVKIMVPKGNYTLTPGKGTEMDVFGKECFLLRNAANIVVDFGGSTFGIKRWGIAFLRTDKCRDVAFMNATVDWDEEIPFNQTIVTAKDEKTNKVTVRVEEGFAEFDAPYFAKSENSFAIIMDAVTPGRMKPGTPIHFSFRKEAVKRGDRLWEFEVHGKNNIKYFDIGDRVIKFARDNGAQSLCDSHDSERVTYYEITSYTTGGSGHYTAFRDSELAILHCSELIKEGRWFGGNADGVHAKANRIGPWIEGLIVDGIGDDSIAFYTRPSKIHAAHIGGNPRCFLFYDESFNLEAGDDVVFFNPRQGIYFAEAAVVESKIEGGYHRVVFDRDLPMPGKIGPDLTLTDQVWNRSKTCGDFMIRNCRLSNVRRYGMVFRALRGVAENNSIEGTSASGILSLNEPYWPNGPMSSNILIQNNTLKNNCFDLSHPFGSIALVAGKYPQAKSDGPAKFQPGIGEGQGPYNVLIRNNTISDWRYSAIHVSGGKNVTIENNKILAGKAAFFHADNVAIRIFNSKGVSLTGNILHDQRPGYTPQTVTDTEGFSEDQPLMFK